MVIKKIRDAILGLGMTAAFVWYGVPVIGNYIEDYKKRREEMYRDGLVNGTIGVSVYDNETQRWIPVDFSNVETET